ncbi:MAG TPA: hypothetical protein VFT74_01910, partial [Isosphaeraceae bacterium]|nr:hypothetical protein [Isosphaeraceae bacterium]
NTRVPKRGRLILIGTVSASIPTTGPNTGTATGGISGINTNSYTASSLTRNVNNDAWTDSDLQTRWLAFLGGPGSTGSVEIANEPDMGFSDLTPMVPIWNNTGSAITAGGINATPTTSTTYQIVDLVTSINSLPPVPYEVKDVVTTKPAAIVANCTADIGFYGLKFNYASGPQVVVENCLGRVKFLACDFRGASAQKGIVFNNCSYPIVNHCQFVGNQTINFLNCMNTQLLFSWFQNSTAAVTFQDVMDCNVVNTLVNNPGAGAFSFFHCLRGFVGGNTFFNSGSGDGYAINHTKRMYLSTATGTGISGYGRNIGGFTDVRIQSTASGALGEINVNGFVLTQAQLTTCGRVENHYVCLDAT